MRCRLAGCEQQIDFIPTGRMKKDGSREAAHIVNVPPEQRIVLRLVELDIDHDCAKERCVGVEDGAFIHQGIRGRIEDTWIDHHGTCKPHLRAQEVARARRREKAVSTVETKL
jgi:hypothetical protein